MNPSSIDNPTHDPQCFKVFLRIFIERIRRNRDDVPGVVMSDLFNKSTSSTSLEEETTPQKSANTTLNYPISTPKEVRVNLKITLDDCETVAKQEDIEDDFLDASGDEEKETKPSREDKRIIPHNNSDAREGRDKDTIDVKEELEDSQVHILPDRSETMDMWETQLKNLISLGSEELAKKLEEGRDVSPAYNNENKHPKRIENAGYEVEQVFQAVTPLCPQSSKSWGFQYQNIAKKCSHGVEEEVSHEETDYSVVPKNAVEKTQCESNVEKYPEIPKEEPDEPTDDVERKCVHLDSRKKPEAYCFRAIVPPNWHSTLNSKAPVSYGWKVASLVRLFENPPQASGALQTDEIVVKNPPIKHPDGDHQQSSALTDTTQDVCVESEEKPETFADEQDSKASMDVSRKQDYHSFQPNVSPNKLQRPEHCISDIRSLVMLKYEKPSYANISPRTDAREPLVVQDIVLDKFKDNWNRSKQRKIRRESLRKSLSFQSCSDEGSIHEYSEIEDNCLYEACVMSAGDYKDFLNKASSDSGLSRSDDTESSRISVKSGAASDTSSGYEQQRLLKEVLVEKAKSTGNIGDESGQGDIEGPYNTIPERSCTSLVQDQTSIGSSNISALLSSCPARRSETLSYYSASSKTRKPPPVPTVTSVGYYDSVPDKVNELLRERDVQLEITHQVSKAVLICRRQRKVVGQDIQVEAEKILLVATRRRDIIDEELKNCSNTPKETPPISVSVSMKNFNFSRAILMSGSKYCRKYSWFFVLVLEAGTSVLASEVVKGDSEILFEDCFRFEGKSEDFPINVKLFALVLKNHKKKMKNCRRMISAPIPLPNYTPTHSFFNLWGSCKLIPSRLSKPGKNCFTLTQIPPEASLANTFSAEMEMNLKIMVYKRGFLTVGAEEPNRLPVWNRRWCVLDGSNLKYWNYPNEEELSEPVGRLDLVYARSHQVQLVNKELCPWPKCLSLDIEWPESASKEYFLSADTKEEFNEWKDQLNLVLGYLSKWKSSQDEVECGE